MSSPTYPNPTIPPPGAWPSRPSLDDSAHRRSIDQRQSPFLHLSQPNSSAHHADSSEGSRRNSMTSGSIHHSPSSLCGSSRHLARFDEQGSLQTAGELPTRGEPGFVGSARLPWITTSAMDSESGPRSAPVASGRLRSSGTGSAPIRSSSSPDPWMNQTSQRSSPSTSPIDHRPNLEAGHGQVYFQGSLVPPYLHGQERRPSPASSLTGGRPLPPRKASDQSTSSQSPSTAAVHLDSVGMSDGQPLLQWPQPRTRKEGGGTICGQCGQTVHGQFVRAMGKVYHLNCFRCKDCNKVVAQKFFPVEDGDGMYPLCERDYFARLDLICAKCDQALRASYITACGAKYHVEHFTCSECDVLFGPNDSYYEHDGNVYCHYHYSTRFAVKCVGCETAILKQFVEMNRNGRNECWHPECYMISKFWNVRLASKAFNTPASSAVASTISLLEMSSITAPGAPVTSASQLVQVPFDSPNPDSHITPIELKERQEAMEMKVQQIWHVLSGYEESSAALIGDMLRAVNERNLLDIILLAERFILHVETLFAVIDDIEAQFAMAGAKGIPHAREAKQLCRKLVNLFSNMSQISPAGGPSPSSNELFTLITQLAHYLKILIRIALTGSIKLEREYNNQTAMTNCLARLNLLAMDSGDPNIKQRGDWPEVNPQNGNGKQSHNGHGEGFDVEEEEGRLQGDEEQLKKSMDALTRRPTGYLSSTKDIAYGYRSLAPEVTGETTLRGPQDEDFIPLEGCAQCGTPIEEDCIRLGMFLRWHCACVACNVCGETALQSVREDTTDEGSSHSHTDAGSNSGIMSRQNSARNTPAKVDYFWFAPEHFPGMTKPPEKIWCGTHKNPNGSWKGFEGVSRLEQYAFLLHIALRRLYVHFRLHHSLQSVRDHGMSGRPESEVKRMKSVTLDRKLSSTARLPQRSMVVESPAGRMADGNGQIISARGAESPTPMPKERQTEIIITSEDASNNATTVNVLRPPFARNNTSVKIIKENSEESPQRGFRRVSAPKEDDAITLGDISLLADKDRRPDNRPLLSNLSPLQSIILRHFALLQLQKTSLGPLIDLDDMLDLLDARKGQWWNKIFKGNAKKDTKKKGLFGVPIEVLVERTGSDSSFGVPNSQVRVPEFIEDIISTMRQMDMAVEGVFRKNGNIRKLQALVEALDKDSTAVNLSEENVIQLAALLKRFLRELPDPLLTFRLHKLFCAAATLPNLEERNRCLHLLVSLLPKYNRDTLEVLFIFLKWVSSFSYREEETGSKMDLANLATVICPSILYAKGSNAVKDDSFTAIAAVQELLENQDEYYRVPSELLFVIQEGIYQIFAKDLDLPPKEIFRHCSKYTQARNAAQPQQQRLGIPHSSSSSQVSQTGVSRSIESATRISQVSIAAPDSSSGNYRPPLP
ncbi:rho GTPase activator [Cryptococcus deuterogattii 99/473]|uniref:Rho GTPase activator n=1 Tax=Cryptococcus deuterogattii Ram5 TaxID=1296110 RepID=A0A0D0V1W0_9TREE|nr:rho GTPase activator [Cryptococcus deuterogattii Ram5]KIS00026.1 rho GTPase activator [Cryptococcus deuterogattii 2001/935-1]KIY58725.1 rho GTPase activator [Cryptococcus deuterogattii 99/473]